MPGWLAGLLAGPMATVDGGKEGISKMKQSKKQAKTPKGAAVGRRSFCSSNCYSFALVNAIHHGKAKAKKEVLSFLVGGRHCL